MGDTNITVKVPKEKREQLKKLEAQTGIQMGSLIRSAIYKKLEEELKAE